MRSMLILRIAAALLSFAVIVVSVIFRLGIFGSLAILAIAGAVFLSTIAVILIRELMAFERINRPAKRT